MNHWPRLVCELCSVSGLQLALCRESVTLLESVVPRASLPWSAHFSLYLPVQPSLVFLLAMPAFICCEHAHQTYRRICGKL